MAETSGSVIRYASARRVTPNRMLHVVARACGVAPLILGLLLYSLYFFTRDFGWAFGGLVMLCLGGVCFLIGITCATIYWFQLNQARPADVAPERRLFHIDLAILLLNLPVAAFCACSGLSLAGRNPHLAIEVENHGTVPISRFVLAAPGAAPLVMDSITVDRGWSKWSDFTARDGKSLQYVIEYADHKRSGVIAPITGSFNAVEITITDNAVIAKGVTLPEHRYPPSAD